MGLGGGVPQADDPGLSMALEGLQDYAADHRIAGELPEVELSQVAIDFVEALGEALRDTPLFVRDGKPVTINTSCARIDPMTPNAFVTFVDRHAKVVKWVKNPKRGDDDEEMILRRVSITAQSAKWILESADFLCFLRPLRKLEMCRLPVMRQDGKVERLENGYDPESEIFTADPLPALEDWGVPEAMEFIEGVFGDFPLTQGENGQQNSLAVLVMGLLNLYCANLLPRFTSRPAFAINSNTQKSGKSLIAKMMVSVVTGQLAATTFPTKSERGKLKEMLNSAALGADPYLFFDNCTGLVEDGELAAFIQAGQWTDRRMRTQSKFVVENVTTVYLTGVDFQVGADMAQRCCFVDLFVEEGTPNMRKFERVLDERWIMNQENRRLTLSALWAIVRHWAKDEPSKRRRGGKMLPGFEAYAELMGGIVMSTGALPDPFDRPNLDTKDRTEADFLELLGTMAELDLEDGAWKFAQIIEACRCRGYFAWLIPPHDDPDKADIEALRMELNMGGEDDDVDHRMRSALGKILSKRADGSRVRGGDSTGRVFAVAVGGVVQRVRFKAVGAASTRSRRYVVTVEA